MWYINKAMGVSIVGHIVDTADSPMGLSGKTDLILFKNNDIAQAWIEAMNKYPTIVAAINLFKGNEIERDFIISQDISSLVEYILGYTLLWDDCDDRLCLLKASQLSDEAPVIGQALLNPMWDIHQIFEVYLEKFLFYWAYKNRVLVHFNMLKNSWLHQDMQLAMINYEKVLLSKQ